MQGHLNTGQSEARDIDSGKSLLGSVAMSNVLSQEKKQQVIALGKLSWRLRLPSAQGMTAHICIVLSPYVE